MIVLSMVDYRKRRMPPPAILASRGGLRREHTARVLRARRQADGFSMDYPESSPVDRLSAWWLSLPPWAAALVGLVTLGVWGAIIAAWIVS